MLSIYIGRLRLPQYNMPPFINNMPLNATNGDIVSGFYYYLE